MEQASFWGEANHVGASVGQLGKEATEKENLDSGVDSASLISGVAVKPSNGISINDAQPDDAVFGDVFGGSDLAMKDLLKDETKENVKAAYELDNTGGVGVRFNKGADLMLKVESKGIAKPGAFELDDTGSAGLDFDFKDSVVNLASSINKSDAIESTKVCHDGDGLLKSKGSSFVLKEEATEKENLDSGVDSASLVPGAVKTSNGISINDAQVDDAVFGDVFGGSDLAMKDLLKDETKENVKAAYELDNTGGVGVRFNKGADLMLKVESKGIAKPGAFELDDTGSAGLDFDFKDSVVNLASSINKSDAIESTKVCHDGDGLLKSKGSSFVLKEEATEKENLDSGVDSASLVPGAVKTSNGISINDAQVDDVELGDLGGRLKVSYSYAHSLI